MEKYIPSTTGRAYQSSPSKPFSNSQINKLRESLSHLREENQNYQKEIRILNQSIKEVSNNSEKLELAIAERLKEIEKLRRNSKRAENELEVMQNSSIKEKTDCEDSEKSYNEKKENKRSVTNLSRRLDIFREMLINYKTSKSKLEKLKDIQKYEILFHRLIKINRDLTSQAQFLLNRNASLPYFANSTSQSPSLMKSQNNSSRFTPQKNNYDSTNNSDNFLLHIDDFSHRSSSRTSSNSIRKKPNSNIYIGLLTGLGQKMKQNYKVIQSIPNNSNFTSSSGVNSHSSLRPSYFNQDNSTFSSPRNLGSHIFNCNNYINEDYNFGINDERYTKANIDKFIREKERELKMNYDYRDLNILIDRFDRFKDGNQKRAIARAKKKKMQMSDSSIKESEIDNDIVHAEDYDESYSDTVEAKIVFARKTAFSVASSPTNRVSDNDSSAKKIKFSINRASNSNNSNDNSVSFNKANANPDPIRLKKPLMKKSPPRIEKDKKVTIIKDCRNVLENVGSKPPPSSPISPTALNDLIEDDLSDSNGVSANLQQIAENIQHTISEPLTTVPETNVTSSTTTTATATVTESPINSINEDNTSTVASITETKIQLNSTKLSNSDSQLEKTQISPIQTDEESHFQIPFLIEEEEEENDSGSANNIHLSDLEDDTDKSKINNSNDENKNNIQSNGQVGGASLRARHNASRNSPNNNKNLQAEDLSEDDNSQQIFSPKPPETNQTDIIKSPHPKSAKAVNESLSKNYSDEETYDDSLNKNIPIKKNDNEYDDASITESDNDNYPGYNRLKTGGKYAFSRHLMKNNLTKRISRASLIANVNDLECQVDKLRSEIQMLEDELRLNEFERNIEAEKKRKMQIEKEQEIEKEKKLEREKQKLNLRHTIEKNVSNYYIDMKRDEIDFNQFKKNRINDKICKSEQQQNQNNSSIHSSSSNINVFYDNQSEVNNDIIDNDYYIDYVKYFRNDVAASFDLKSTETSITKQDIDKIERIQKLRLTLYSLNQENDQLRKKYEEEKKKSKAASYIEVANKLQSSIETRKQLMRDGTFESVKCQQNLDKLQLRLNDEISKNELIREKTERILQKPKPSATGMARAINELKLAENAIKRKMNSLKIEEELIDAKINEIYQVCDSDEIEKEKKEINVLKNAFRRRNDEDLSPIVEMGEIEHLKKMLDNLHKKSFQLKQSEFEYESKINNDLNELHRLSSIVPSHYFQSSGSNANYNSYSSLSSNSINSNYNRNLIVFTPPIISQFDHQNYLVNTI